MIIVNGTSANSIKELEIEPFSLRSRSARQYETTYIPNIDTPLIEKKAQREMVTVNVSADLFDKTKIDSVMTWLDGKAVIIDDDEPNKYRVGEVLGEVTVEPWADEENRILHLDIPFLCDPYIYYLKEFGYSWNQDNFKNDEGNLIMKLFHCIGNTDCLPNIEITLKYPKVQTMCELYVNHKRFCFLMPHNMSNPDLDPYTPVCLDTTLRQVYTKTTDGKKRSLNYLIQEGTFNRLKFKPSIKEFTYTYNTFQIKFYTQGASGKYTEWVQNAEFDVKIECNPRWL